jgi:hypothetical protein
MLAPLSFAQACAIANGSEVNTPTNLLDPNSHQHLSQQIVHYSGALMTKDLALAIDGSETAYGIHRQQLKATDRFIAGKKHAAPFTLRTVEILDPEFHPFMRLPYDVKYATLKEIVPAQNIRAFLQRSSVRIQLPSIAYAGNTNLRRECLLVALNQCTMEIHSGPGNERLRAWLAKVDFSGVGTSCKTGFDAITSLTFPYFSYFPYGQQGISINNDVGLAVACKNLRNISIHFSPRPLDGIAFQFRGQAGEAGLIAAQIRANYQLDGILGAKKLEKFTVAADGSEYGLAGLREMVAWFRKEFELIGQRVSIEMN